MVDTPETTTVSVPPRIRLSVWSDPKFVFAPSLVAGGRGVIDDVSVLVTLSNTSNLAAKIDPMLDARLGSAATAKSALTKAIDACHKAKVQCVAGYDLVANAGAIARFNKWLEELAALNAAARTQEIGRFNAALVKLLDDPFGTGTLPATERFDGLSFDFEALGGNPVKLAPVLSEFYRDIASRLTSNDGDRMLGVAAGGMVSDEHSHFHPGVRPKSLRSASKALASAIAQRYDMALGTRNLLIRPMAYDNFSVSPPTPDQVVREWHADIVNYALGPAPKAPAPPAQVGLGPGNFQLGIKNFKGSSNHPPPAANLDSTLDDAGVRTRCEDLRARRVGMCIFAFPETIVLTTGQPLANAQSIADAFWKKVHVYNFILNGPVNSGGKPDMSKFDPADPSRHCAPAGVAGGPLQVPLGNAGVARLGGP